MLDPDQDDALTRAERRLHHIFEDDDYERSDAARKAERLAARIAIRVCAPRLLPRWRSF